MKGNDGAWKGNIEDFSGQDHDQQDRRNDQAILVYRVINEEFGPGKCHDGDKDQQNGVDACP